MVTFVLRRLAISIPIVVVSSFVVFMLVATTTDPIGDLRLRPGISQQVIKLRERQLNLDKPAIVRYGIWVKGIVRGDLGRSSGTNEPVGERIKRHLAVTLRLVVAASVLGAIIAAAVGVVQAMRQYSSFDYAGTFLAFLFFSMPVFWLAAVLKDLGIRVNQWLGQLVFFTVGEQSPNLVGSTLGIWADRLGHLLLPSITLILINVAGWSRYQRGSMLEVLSADYLRTARAKGLPKRAVVFRHALRNALIPLTTIIAIDFAGIIGGAVITETVYGWSGMGRLLVDSLRIGDVNVVQAWLLVTAVMVVVFNLIADVLYGYLDPRIRYA
ncbi:MAG: ABC transporter permease [Actinomycetota bacterium]